MMRSSNALVPPSPRPIGVRARSREDTDVETALHTGDVRRATTLLMRRYGDRVYGFALAMTRDRDLADEVRQQVFIEAYRDLWSFEGRSSLRTWLYGIARHRCLDATKQLRRHRSRFKYMEADAQELHEIEQQLDRRRLAEKLTRCLAGLTPASQEAIALRYCQELSYEEAARLAGHSAGVLERRVARALAVLRRRTGQWCK